MKSIDKTIILMASRIFGSANIFLLSILFARMLLKSDYGTYIQVNMIISLMVLVLALGLPPSLFYFLPKEINQKHLVKRSLIILVTVGIINLLILLFLKDYISVFLNNEELGQYIVFAGICIICQLGSNIITPVLLVLKNSVVLASVGLFRSVLLFCTMAACLFMGTGLKILLYVFTGNYVIGLIISLWVVLDNSKHFSDDYSKIIVSVKDQLKYSIPLALSGMLWILGREIDKYVVSHYLNPEDLAVYARGAVEIPLVNILAGTIAQVYLPNWVSFFDKKDYKNLLQLWHLTITKTALIMFPIFIIFQIVGYDFIVFMYSSEYAGSVSIFMVYLFLLPMQITQYTAIVESSGKTILISVGYVFQIGLNILFSVILIKRLGSIGPAFVTVITMYLWVSYMLFVISRILDVSIIKVFPWKKLMRLMSICVLAGIFPFLLKLWIERSGFLDILVNMELIYLSRMTIVGVLFLFLYLSLLFVTKTLDDDDKATIYRWLMINKMMRLFGKKSCINS